MPSPNRLIGTQAATSAASWAAAKAGSSCGQTCTAVLLDNSLGVQYSGNVPAASHILRAADGFYLLTDSTVECFNKAGEFQWTQPMDAKPQAGVLNGRQLLVFSGNTVQQVTAPEPDSSSAS